MGDDKREALADLEHQQWAHWTRYMLKTLEPLLSPNLRWNPDVRGNAEAALERWLRQINTPYADLTEKEKDSDREWADKVLEITGQEDLAQHEIVQFLRYLQRLVEIHDAPLDLKAHLPRIQRLLDYHD